MSYDVQLKGELGFASTRAAREAVAAWRAAIDDEDACSSVVTLDDLEIKGKTIAIELAASCPASMWQETIAFLEELATRAESGTIRCYFDGELDETIEASAKKRRAATANAKPKPDRIKPDPAALRWAAQFGELDKIDALIAAGTDPSAPDPSDDRGTTPLMMAAYHGKSDAIAHLIAAGADLDAQDQGGSTALHWAVINQNKRGRRRCLELLVAAGANTQLREREVIGGFTPLEKAKHWKRQGGREELEALLAARRPRGRRSPR